MNNKTTPSEVFYFVEIQGYKKGEVAKILGINRKTIKRNLQKIK